MLGDGRLHGSCGNHQPDRARLAKLAHQVGSAEAPTALSLDQLGDRLRRPVKNHAFVAAVNEPFDHVGSHTAKTYHSELHR